MAFQSVDVRANGGGDVDGWIHPRVSPHPQADRNAKKFILTPQNGGHPRTDWVTDTAKTFSSTPTQATSCTSTLTVYSKRCVHQVPSTPF